MRVGISASVNDVAVAAIVRRILVRLKGHGDYCTARLHVLKVVGVNDGNHGDLSYLHQVSNTGHARVNIQEEPAVDGGAVDGAVVVVLLLKVDAVPSVLILLGIGP